MKHNLFKLLGRFKALGFYLPLIVSVSYSGNISAIELDKDAPPKTLVQTIEAPSPSIKPFVEDSLKQIKQGFLDRPFVLLVWSIDCLPCREEFSVIRLVKEKYPLLNLSIIATESFSDTPQLSTILKEHQLLDQDNWAFAQSNSAKLRYSLDSGWYGELPRAYFYDAQHNRTGVSGKLHASQVITWINKVSNSMVNSSDE
ncbi:MAG: hypothetical protein KUG78_16405 [Kangiellaceae bacterium]|nr:hypothetical protein [Kangiellaceae bacterium]